MIHPIGHPSPALLALNNAHARELSELDAPRLATLVQHAFSAIQIGPAPDAFLFAFDQSAPYDSPNFLWFRSRYPRFIYVDRLAVRAHARGQGLARHLYSHLFTQARTAGHHMITAEVNLIPPNPASDALHEALGFITVGTTTIHNGAKTVRYLQKHLPR